MKISPKFVPKGTVDSMSAALVQVMAWYQIGDKPLSETMLIKTYDAILSWRSQMNNDPYWIFGEKFFVVFDCWTKEKKY